MIEYRSFHNSDPPHLVKLWHECRLGRGAAEGFTIDAFDSLIFSQSYFDRRGLIVAVEDGRLVGYLHAGFGPNEEGDGLSHETGVICIVMVHPEYRRQGIARELVARGEKYLQESGSKVVFAGASQPRDPFYVGMYGGSELAGFLESDPDARPFFESLNYQPAERHFVFQRDIGTQGSPVSIRLQSVRRKMEVTLADSPIGANWWWHSRFGRLDSITFQMRPKTGGDPVASATVVGLDLYLNKWHERAIGITDLYVDDLERRKGYGQALVLEISRRLREESVTRVEAHVPESNSSINDLVKSIGFEQVDTGVVYQKPID